MFSKAISLGVIKSRDCSVNGLHVSIFVLSFNLEPSKSNQQRISFESRFLSLTLADLDPAETETQSLTHGTQVAVNTHAVALPEEETVDIAALQAGSETPDMTEGNHSVAASPPCGDTESAAECGELVAQSFPEVEASVGEFPDAINGFDAVRFTQDVLKLALK